MIIIAEVTHKLTASLNMSYKYNKDTIMVCFFQLQIFWFCLVKKKCKTISRLFLFKNIYGWCGVCVKHVTSSSAQTLLCEAFDQLSINRWYHKSLIKDLLLKACNMPFDYKFDATLVLQGTTKGGHLLTYINTTSLHHLSMYI